MSAEKPNLPLVVIAGRPNVGKSSLFNAICGKRLSIVHSESGVTRDRVSAKLAWKNIAFQLIDTGGILFYSGEKFREKESEIDIRGQIQAALDAADIILFVTDITEAGPVAMDFEISAMLRRLSRKVLLVLNKADNPDIASGAAKFAGLGWKEIFPVSCVHRTGIESLLDAVVEKLPAKMPLPLENALKIAVVGRPNVGKSSIVNRLLGEERMIVSKIAGTTRDSVDIEFEVRHGGKSLRSVLVDTAGLRQKRRVDSAVEIFSIMRTEKAIEKADIVLFVTEANEFGASSQDRKVASIISENSKPCIILVNKCDLIHAKDSLDAVRNEIARTLPFMSYAPVLACSATSGFGFGKIKETLLRISEDMKISLPTAMVNRLIAKAYERNKPPSDGKRIFKLYYATMKSSAPPTFIVFANHPQLCKPNYVNYLKNFIRDELNITGMPIRIEFRKRT